MAESALTNTEDVTARYAGWRGIAADWSSDQRAFKNVSWGKAMMWIFLLSDTFIFGSFLLSYMTARMSTTVPWPNPSEVFALTIGGASVPLILIARSEEHTSELQSLMRITYAVSCLKKTNELADINYIWYNIRSTIQ